MALAAVSLDDKYALDEGRIYLTGTQALVRLPMMQRQRDVAAGLNTACFISGYRGLAARRLRPRAVERQAFRRAQPHPLPARRQRGPRRDRGVGQPAGRPVPGRQIRRRLRHVVRQGAGRRSLGRRAQARQHGRHGAGGWRARAGRRRPRLQVVDPAAPVGIRLHGRPDPGAQPGRRAGVPRPRSLRLGDVALRWDLGRPESGRRDARQLGLGHGRPREGDDRAARRFRDAAGRPQHPLARRADGPGIPVAPPQGLCRAGVCPRQPPRPHGDRRAATPARHRHHRQVVPRRAPGARRSRHRRCARRRDRHPALQGRHAVAARARGRARPSPRG